MADEITPPPAAPAPAAPPAAAKAEASASPPVAAKPAFRNPYAAARPKTDVAPAPAAPPGPTASASTATPEAPKTGKVQIPASVARKLTEAQTAISDGKAKDKELDTYRTVLAGYAKRDMEALTPEQRDFVVETAGKDPRAQLALLERMRAKGMISTAPAPTRLANTGPAAAPKADVASADPDIAVYRTVEDMKAKGLRSAAAQYQMQNLKAYQSGAKKAAAH